MRSFEVNGAVYIHTRSFIEKGNSKNTWNKNQSVPSVSSKTETAGITLVALVVTIVVLLILAGITIVYVFGDNGVFGQASQAKIQTELGKIEEQAGIIYSDKFIEKQSGKIENISNRDIVDELIENGNKIEIRTAGAESVTGISIEPTAISMDKNKVATIKVKLEGSEDGYLYYAIIDGKYYKMNFHNSNLTIEREATEPEGTVETPAVIEVKTGYNTTYVTNVQINQSTKTIEITSGAEYGNTTLTVKYGSKTADCTVTVEKSESDWEKIAKIAKEIAEGRTTQTVDSSSTQATVTVDGKEETIKVGEEFYVKHDGRLRKVRVLGFKHDTLTNPTEAYGSGTTALTAGISFEFAEFMRDNSLYYGSSCIYDTSSIRTYLEGSNGLGNISEVCKTNIKQVNKLSQKGDSMVTLSDKLWLLSCYEVGIPGATEGETYRYYLGSDSSARVKYSSKRLPELWWLRTALRMSYDVACISADGALVVHSSASSVRPLCSRFLYMRVSSTKISRLWVLIHNLEILISLHSLMSGPPLVRVLNQQVVSLGISALFLISTQTNLIR
ncbi:MAG: hypothetical protein HFJ30_07915 [Clostridia bacterium]|jgi:hypothetical protein|nr:hypothetical protein [Clostridia bacterium]